MNITLTGAGGFVGRRLIRRLEASGHSVRRLGRRPGDFQWDALGEAAVPEEALAGARAVVHLAGEPVAQRWTPEAKERIRRSRADGTRRLVEAVSTLSPRPEVLVCASAVGYYGDREDEVLTEASAPGSGFLAETCVEWERTARLAEALGMRVVTLRTGVVLGPEGGALAKMLPAFRLGGGGPLAGGRQWMSWIHVEDMVRLIEWAVQDSAVGGALNATAPNPERNEEFTRALGRALRRPAFFPVPGFGLRLLFGEMAEVLTGSQRAVPEAAQRGGFRFLHAELASALSDLLH